MITYLLKSSACIAFVYIVYLVLFRHTDRFQLNRLYLLAGLVLSFAVPLVVMPATPVDIVTTVIGENYPMDNNLNIRDVVAPTKFDHTTIIYFYYSGVVVSLLITLVSISRIVILYRSAVKRVLLGKTIAAGPNIQPFSFFGILFLRSHDEDPIIVAHEMVHIRQHHWIDLMMVEIAGIILWFNPVIHFYRRSIAIQHEYIADREVVSGVPIPAYLDCITRQLESRITSLASNFNSQSIKQRIIMITSSNNYSALRYAVALPVVALFLMAFATREAHNILPIQNKELRSPVDVSKLKAGEGARFGKRIHPVTNKEAFHNGVDFILGAGNSVYAAASGTVVKAAMSGDYGNLIIIRHGKVLTTRYAHLEKMLVKDGERVDAGQLIGTVGSTGSSTGPHLHFEVLENSKPVDPVPYLNMEID